MLKNSYDCLVDSRRESILGFLKTRGHATLGEIAAHLEVSKQGALRHLEALEASGLALTSHAEPHGRGRPENVYTLTAAAGDHFPDGHRELAGDLVAFLSEEQLRRFFERRAERLIVSKPRRALEQPPIKRAFDRLHFRTELGLESRWIAHEIAGVNLEEFREQLSRRV